MNDAPGFLEQGELAVQAGQTIFCWADNILLGRQLKTRKKKFPLRRVETGIHEGDYWFR